MFWGISLKMSLLTCYSTLALMAGCHLQTPDSKALPQEHPNTDKIAPAGADKWLLGNPEDVQTPTQYGIVAMGGSTDVDAAIRWMIERSGGGDFVVVRATGTPAYNSYIFDELGGVDSVETILVDSRAKANDPEINRRVRNAEALFIAGGNQADYYDWWEDTDLADSINWLAHNKRIPIGGTSSGCNVLGDLYFTAHKGAINSEQALSDPYDRRMHLSGGALFRFPWLESAIVDPHFNSPDRMGRMVSFIAHAIEERLVRSRRDIFGLGIDQRTAVAIDESGLARIFSYGDTGNSYGYAYFIEPREDPEEVLPEVPLHFYGDGKALSVYRVRGTVAGENTFDLKRWRGQGGDWFDLGVYEGELTEDLVRDFLKDEDHPQPSTPKPD